MPLTERPPKKKTLPEVNIDADSPEQRAVVSRLAYILGGQLDYVGDVLVNAKATPWQLCGLCARLDKLRAEVEYLRRDAAKLDPATATDDS